MDQTTNGNEWYVNLMRQRYTDDPGSVDASWRAYFEGGPQPAGAPPAPAAPPAPPTAPSAPGARPAAPAAPPTAPSAPAAVAPPSPTIPEPTAHTEGTADTIAATADDNAENKSVTRSDLPPAPPSRLADATSPYTRLHTVGAASELSEAPASDDLTEALKGIARATAKNMDASIQVPTASTQRNIPAKLLIENRALINSHLARSVGGKVSFTHLIGYAIVEALCEMPGMNVRYEIVDNKPSITHLAHVGLGLAVDVTKPDGTRNLIVPVLHEADTLTFPEFVAAYDDIVRRSRTNELTPADFAGATLSLTNPGTLGTTTSVPRLMQGQGLIVGVGATDYPAEFAGMSPRKLAALGVGKTMFMSSTYDHRVIQGAESGQFLGRIAAKLTGRDGFYDRVFNAYHVPYPPYAWEDDHDYDLDREKGKPARIAELIHAYRSRGHLAADTDPLEYRVRRHPDLDLTTYGLSVWDLDRAFPTGGFGGTDSMVLRDILDRLRDTYTRTIGIEYMHIQDPEQRRWVQARVEQPYEVPDPAEQRHILSTLNHAEAFEEFLQTKYVGQKRFSLEGGESLIPLLDQFIGDAARAGIHEVAIGMAHRGRLNVLANIAGKSYGQIFSEFEGNQDPRTSQGSGDVKYHLGTEGVYQAEDGVATQVYLAANPSHLEAADPVLEGIVRAKQDELMDDSLPVIPVLVHGDAAFIGQGVVQELLNMSQLEGYRTGGTVHVIVNNQIGFTTGPTSGRSTRYPTDLAKGLQVPIMHVNGNDPEAVVRCAHLAFQYREQFHKDVIIDMVCYRRRGHNEGDDPSMTQPVMYELIDRMPSVRTLYQTNLIGRGQLSEEEAAQSLKEYEDELSRILDETRQHGWSPEEGANGAGSGSLVPEDDILGRPESQLPGQGMMIGWESAVPAGMLARVGDAYTAYPAGFVPHPKLAQLAEKRRRMAHGELPVDWGFGELMALGSLLMEGTPVRFSGQDARRATFVQRHAVLHDHEDGREFTPLEFLTGDQARFDIFDSPLSEYAVLGFEYGYSVERPDSLVVWEAQFGDFANGAQTVIDEFISSAEAKWGQRTSLVMMLPHGYEGQGPDHSSARIERYLQLCAEDNMWVVQPSTPANHFHMLRAQAYKRPRKPLIAITPKQLLRLSAATSSLEDFTGGSFRPVIDEVEPTVLEGAASVDRVLMCTGRVYYDLAKERSARDDHATAIIRIEQLYPSPTDEVRAVLDRFPGAELVWVQDEPLNQGAAPHLSLNLFPDLGRGVRVVSRPAAAAPAVGRASEHKAQQRAVIDQALQR